MPKLNNVTNSMMSNPLVVVIAILLIILIVLGVIRIIMPTFSLGLGVNAHVGSLKGSVNLEAFENNTLPQFVIFKAEWCGHCKNTMPEIEKLKQENIPNVEIVVIDSDEKPDLIKECGVKGFPTIRMYPKGLSNKDNYEDFDGERSVQGFKTFLERLMRN